MIQRQRMGFVLFFLSLMVVLVMGLSYRLDGAEHTNFEIYSTLAFLVLGMLMFLIDERKGGDK